MENWSNELLSDERLSLSHTHLIIYRGCQREQCEMKKKENKAEECDNNQTSRLLDERVYNNRIWRTHESGIIRARNINKTSGAPKAQVE